LETDGAVGALDGFGYLVNILRLRDSFEIVLEDFGEEVCGELVTSSE